jgi:hypothetical protein
MLANTQRGLIVSILCITGCSGFSSPNSQVVQTPDDVEIIGRTGASSNATRFYFLNVKDFSKAAHSNWKCRVGDSDIDLASVTPEALKNAGAEIVVPDYDPAGNEIRAFFSWGVQNRDGGIEMYFKGGRLTQLIMRWHLSTPSPFQFSLGDSGLLSMPLSEAQIRSTFGNPIRVKDVNRE